MNDKPRHPWFRYSLRTLFVVVTVICVWLGWAVNWKQQRHEFLARDDVACTYHRPTGEIAGTNDGHASEILIDVAPPWVLNLFGERGIADIFVQTPQDEVAAKRLFPESQVSIEHWQPSDSDLLP